MISASRQAHAAAFAAALASAGDLLLLYVGNARCGELGLPPIGRAWLWLGGALGVAAIPVYALGYRAAGRIVAVAAGSAGRALFLAGAAGALLGTLIHGLTAAHIGAELDAGAPGCDPVTSLMSGGSLLPALWGLAALLVLAASVLFVWFVGRGRTAAPRVAALANPALVTIALAAVGLPCVLLRYFLTPAAPNLAHLVFFAVCARIVAGDAPDPERV